MRATARWRDSQGPPTHHADVALDLERVLGASARMWLGLQTTYDLVQATAAAAEPPSELGGRLALA